MSNKIRFVANRPWLDKDSFGAPTTILKTIPDWYRKADRFAKNQKGDFVIGPDKGKIPTWKACPAVFDVMGTGYAYVTPYDIEFFINDRGVIDAKILNNENSPSFYPSLVTPRPPMPQFHHPEGYYKDHFAWFPEWAIETPEGYSALYVHPLNRYELPFFTVSGIIDNDDVNLPGSMPFFVREGFVGIIEAGTPFAQIIPFKREDWESEIIIESKYDLARKNAINSQRFRRPNGGVYKNEVWSQRKYT
jgi:hypothetical protein